jgi:ribosomal protein S18 acetylase RimI-like enzyme
VRVINLTSRICGSEKIKLKCVRIGDYDNMIETWNEAGLNIKVKGRESKDSIGKELEFCGASFIGAFDRSKGEKLIGLVIANYDGRRGWINRIGVLPEYRKEGVASALISEAEKFLKRKGSKVTAALIDKSNNPSRRLFEKHGYSTNEQILYYSKRESSES